MNNTGIEAADAIDKVLIDTKGLPMYLAGSSAAAVEYDKQHAYTDIDIFVPNQGMYFAGVERLLNRGYHIESDRFEKMWRRHREFGFNAWHTNSMKLLDTTTGTEVNVIYKRVDGHETTRLSQVIESFDFGLLGVGYETETGTFYDMRSYLFGNSANMDQLPMLPYRRETVGKGFMSQHIMLRTPGRYARYAKSYGYDLSLVKPTLVSGYLGYAQYKAERTKDDDQTLAQIAQSLASHIEFDEFDELIAFEAALPSADGLDQIMASLE